MKIHCSFRKCLHELINANTYLTPAKITSLSINPVFSSLKLNLKFRVLNSMNHSISYVGVTSYILTGQNLLKKILSEDEYWRQLRIAFW